MTFKPARLARTLSDGQTRQASALDEVLELNAAHPRK